MRDLRRSALSASRAVIGILIWVCCAYTPFAAASRAPDDPTLDTVARLQALHEAGNRAPHFFAPIRTEIQGHLSRASLEPLHRAAWLRALSFSYFFANNTSRSIEVLNQALAATEGNTDAVFVRADLLQLLGYQLGLTGDLAQARRRLRQGLVETKLLQAEGADLVAALYFTLADSYQKTGEFGVAKRYFERAREIASAHGHALTQQSSTYKLATIARAEGRYDDAIRWHTESLDYYLSHSEYRVLPNMLELARDFLANGEPERAIALASTVGHRSGLLAEQKIDALLLLVEASLHSDLAPKQSASRVEDWLVAVADLLNEPATSNSQNLPVRRLDWARAAVRHYFDVGDNEKVVQVGREALALIASNALRLSAGGEDHRSWLSAAAPFVATFVGVLQEIAPHSVIGVLEFFFELDRNELLPKVSSHSDTNSSNTSQLRGAQARWLESLDVLAALTGLKDSDAAAERAEALRTRDTAREDVRAHQPKAILKQPGETLRLIPSDTESTLSKLQASLSPADVFVRCHVLPKNGFCYAVTRRTLTRTALPDGDTVQKVVAAARAAASNLYSEPLTLRSKLEALSALLPLSELTSPSDYSHLIFADNGAFAEAPITALNISTGAQGGYKPLVSKIRVTRISSANRYLRLSSQLRLDEASETERKNSLVVFANPSLGVEPGSGRDSQKNRNWFSTLPSLLGSEAEAQAISERFEGRAAVKLYTGEAANRSAFLSPATLNAQVLHLATHSYFDQEFPELTGFVVADVRGGGPTLVSLESYTQLPMSAALVVVSGCESLRGRRYTGFGTVGIAQSMLSQGAKNAVGSIWKLPDAPTAVFMSFFYEALESTGGHAGQALAFAQRSMLSVRRYRHPMYWAGFSLHSSDRVSAQNVFGGRIAKR